jgi:hypothetical protein
MTIETTPGKTYAVTCASDCTISTPDGTTIMEYVAGSQGMFVAPTNAVVVSDDSCLITQGFSQASVGLSANGCVRLKDYEQDQATTQATLDAQAKAISTNAKGISSNVKAIERNTASIDDNTTAIENAQAELTTLSESTADHVGDTTVHITSAERKKWNAKQDAGDFATNTALSTHTGNADIHVTTADKERWDAGSNEGVEASIAEVSANLTSHTSDADIHVTAEDKERWDSSSTEGMEDAIGEVKTYAESVKSDLDTHANDTDVHISADERTKWNALSSAGDIDLSDYATNTALTEGLATKQDVGDYVTTEQAEETKKALEEEIATKQASGNYISKDDNPELRTEWHWNKIDHMLVMGGFTNGGVEINTVDVPYAEAGYQGAIVFGDSPGYDVFPAGIKRTGATFGLTKDGFDDNAQLVCQAEVDSSIETALESYTTTEGMTETLADYAKTADVVTLSGTQTISGVKTFSSAPRYASVLTSSSTDSYLVNKATLYRSVPVGAFMWFCGTTVPTGWLECDGSSLSRTSYAKLYAVIGTTYGDGDGDGKTFSLPDLTTVGRFIRSRTSSNTVGTCQDWSFINYSEQIGWIRTSQSATNLLFYCYADGGVNFSTVESTLNPRLRQIFYDTSKAFNVSDEIRPKNISLIACIKY